MYPQKLEPETKPSIRMPAEWEPQQALMLTWPSLKDNAWEDNFQVDVHTCFAEIANTTLHYQNLILVCNNAAHEKFIRKIMAEQSAKNNSVKQNFVLQQNFTLQFFHCATDDAWVRDHGPISTLNKGKVTWNDFTFDGWGKKFTADDDNLITCQLQKHLFPNTPRISYRNVLEGGAIESDGMGTLLTTASCVLNKQRNSEINTVQFTQLMRNALGIKRLFILQHGHLIGDDTDGHIDTLARFADSETLVYQSCTDKTDEHFHALKNMQQELKALRTVNATPYKLLPLPLPPAKYNRAGKRLPASYANFLIINGAVLYPRYNGDLNKLETSNVDLNSLVNNSEPSTTNNTDDEARDVLQQAFPKHVLHGIDCNVLIQQYGSLHCVTMQLGAQPPTEQ